ncbi:MAG TPA: sugar phosphate isomerase/epimerase family protein [Gaiellaceae bacterium]|jgi:sugar phosphate isomerase/epimerase|nr:sugar phosphate isomerase/epimerase family protein [Gaiellaceae bacterium]
MRPPFSISQITTLAATFESDLRAYAAAGVDGIGIWEIKLPEGGDDQALEQLEASGLGRAAAVPAVPSILPLPLMEGPADPRERIDAICASVHRLARFEPSSVVCLTGPGDDRDTVVEGLRTIGDEAERAGVRIGLEPINRIGGEDWTSISSLQEAAELLDDADRQALGIQFDSWHVWNTAEVVEEIERHAHRFVGVHIADWREPTRGWADRVLPGDGVADLPALLGTLERAGWNGFYDLEIFSDNGTFGNAWPGSLWDVPEEELARRGKEAFERAWSARNRTPLDQVSPGAV